MTSGLNDSNNTCLGSLIDSRQYKSLVDHSHILDDLHDSLLDCKMIEIRVDSYKACKNEYSDIMAIDTHFQCSYGLKRKLRGWLLGSKLLISWLQGN